MNKSYCSRAFDHIYSDNTGQYKLCCVAGDNPELKKYTAHNTKPFDFFLSEDMEQIRNDMLEGKGIAGCARCYQVEEQGLTSHREMWLKNLVTDVEPYSVEVKLRIFGSACNLSCYMCTPQSSTTRNKELSKLNTDMFDIEEPEFFQSDEDMVELNTDDVLSNIHLIKKILIIGGEPIMMIGHWKFLDRIPDEHKQHIILEYQTNLTKLNHMKWDVRDYIPKFKDVIFHVSCDHVQKRLAWIRYPIDVPQFENNVIEMKEHISTLNVTVSMLNMMDLFDILGYYHYNFNVPIRLASVVREPTPISIRNIKDKDAARAVLADIEQDHHVPGFIEAELNQLPLVGDDVKFSNYVKQLDKHRKTDANQTFGWTIY